MALSITTFDNVRGGSSFFKALGHPALQKEREAMLARIRAAKAPYLLDNNYGADLAALLPLAPQDIAGTVVQATERRQQEILGHLPILLHQLQETSCDLLIIPNFGSDRLETYIRPFLPAACEMLNVESLRLPADMLTEPDNYLAGRNFATNFAFFRDQDGYHTRLVTANYWFRYGGDRPRKFWCCLFDEQGKRMATWEQHLHNHEHIIVIDSKEVRKHHNLPEFCGQLFIHVIGASGHDIVKYAIDTYHDDGHHLSATHDANAWPSDYFAGLPAPRENESVIVWLQNSHPVAIAAGELSFCLMGTEAWVPYPHDIAPFASVPLDVSTLFPQARWPAQIEMQAGKYLCRPRYEVLHQQTNQRCIAHINVERTDLKPDPTLASLTPEAIGDGFLLVAPILPPHLFDSRLLPTPMARTQQHLPVKLRCYHSSGEMVAEHAFGNLARDAIPDLDLTSLCQSHTLFKDSDAAGHMALMYDFTVGQDADGWLHGLFEYRHRQQGSLAHTSFGSHIFNHMVTYRNEPQSYAGPAPGLSTRLFLRLDDNLGEAFCHLIYPVSLKWLPHSSTQLQLCNGLGEVVSEKDIAIPANGSMHIRYYQHFNEQERAKASGTLPPFIIIRDTTCRLFGYHGIYGSGGIFSLDHMFGF
jgi:hypothetical protein